MPEDASLHGQTGPACPKNSRVGKGSPSTLSPRTLGTDPCARPRAVAVAGWESALLPQVGNLPSLVASIFSASPGSSWRNRLVIRVFIFRLFPTSGKQNVETGEIQDCWKRLLRNRPGNSAFGPLGPDHRTKAKVGSRQPSPQRTKTAGFSASLQF